MPHIIKSSLDFDGKILPWNERELVNLIKEKKEYLEKKQEKQEKQGKEEFEEKKSEIKKQEENKILKNKKAGGK